MAATTRRLIERPLPTEPAALEHLVSLPQEAYEDPDDQVPIFLLGTAWRSGSTLLQRMLTGDRSCLMWGEPAAHANALPNLAETFAGLTIGESLDPTDGDTWLGETTLAHEWIAILAPSLRDQRAAHRQLLLRAYGDPARRSGYETWGIKEVRLSAPYAYYLRFLFPRARIVFLTRDPYRSWRSFKGASPDGWYYRWPGQLVRGPRRYGAVWNRQASSFRDHAAAIGAIHVRYEDLLEDGAAVDRLEEELGMELARDALEHAQAGVTVPAEMTDLERRLLDRQVLPLARDLGYTAPR